MDKLDANAAMEELTMILLYLAHFTEKDGFTNVNDLYAWKGNDFDVLNKLDEEDFIRQGSHPSRSKSVYILQKTV